MKKVAISIGDINGVSLEIALKAHKNISKLCEPIYFIRRDIMEEACKLLNFPITILDTMNFEENNLDFTKIVVGKSTKEAGKLSFDSFKNACDFVDNSKAIGILTLPLNKYSLSLAGIKYKGHTHYLRERYQKEAIMLMGANDLFVALLTDHIRYIDVPKHLYKLENFLINLKTLTNYKKIGVLGLNPHASDNGIIGDEESSIKETLAKLNKSYQEDMFDLLVPDIAFIKNNRAKYDLFVALYHDQGLGPLKTLYFEEAINITLGLPIARVSVGHGSAYDIAYKDKVSLVSYTQALQHLLANHS